jgi:hypothetical protein
MNCRLLLLLALLAAAPALALDREGPGLDVLVLVDRSGSISPNDRQLENELLDLTLTMIARSASQERVRHRVGVLSFGSAPRVDLPLTAVNDSMLPAIRGTLSAIESRQPLGNTNFPAVFGAAADTFAATSSEPPPRLAILLITDGRAYVPGVPRGEGFRALQSLVDARLSPSVTIDVLMFRPNGVDADWRRVPHTRVHRITREPGAALAALHGIVSNLLGTAGQEREISDALDTIALPPYLDLVVFDILRDPSGSGVSIFVPGASQPLDARTPGVEEVRLGSAFSTVAVHRPAAGNWTFRKANSASRVRVLTQQFFPRGMLVGPDPRSPVRQHQHVAIEYRLLDGNGAPLQELAAYPLSVEVTLATPDGRRVAMPMRRAAVADVYRTMSLTECDRSGRYWTEVAVMATDASGRAVRVFEDRWSGFAVRIAAQVDCRLTAPASGERVRVACNDAGDALSLPSSLRLMVHRGGKRIPPDVRLEYRGGGVFEGSLPAAADPGTYALQTVAEPAMLDMRVLPAYVTFIRPERQYRSAVAVVVTAAAIAALFALGRLYVARH